MADLPARTALRLSCFYAAVFAVIGVQLPFWPVWLEARGLNTQEIAVVIAVGVGAKILGNPILTVLADRLGERRRPIVVLAIAATALFALFSRADGFWVILVLNFWYFVAFASMMPLAESLTMLAVRHGGHDYGQIRLWGSIAFIVAAIGAGGLLSGRSSDVLFGTILAANVLTLLAGLLLPDTRPPPVPRVHMPIVQVLRQPGFAVFLAAATAVQASHAAYYVFGTLHWRAAGYGDAVIGALWAEGVIAEILLFAAGTRVLRSLGPSRLILLGGLAGVVRWSVTGLTTALPALIAAQALHAFTFGAVHLGAIHFIARSVPAEMSATAQGLHSGVVMGLGLGAMLLAVGPLYADVGARAFWVMAASAAIGVLLAVRLARFDPPDS